MLRYISPESTKFRESYNWRMATASPLETATMQRGLECPVCHEAYRRPRFLPCGHTLCQVPCLEQIINDKPRFNCPECRCEHAVPESGPSGFPMNVAISRMTEETPETLKVLPGCPICGEDVILLECCHCDLEICEECKIEHIPKFRKKITEILRDFNEEISSKKAACTSLEATLKEQVKSMTDRASADVDKVSEELIEAIREKVKYLKGKLLKFSEDEYDTLEYQKGEALVNLSKASEFCEAELKELNSDKRISHARLAKIQNDFREYTKLESKRKMLMSMRRNIFVQCKLESATATVLDFCDVQIVQSTFSENEVRTVDEDKDFQDNENSLLEQTFTTPLLSIGNGSKGTESMSYPTGIAVDPDTKDIFITDTNNHRIKVFDQSGDQKLSFGSKGQGNEHFSFPLGIIISKKGQVVICDQSNHRVKIHGRDGSFVTAFGQEGSEPGKFKYTFGVAQDQNENIHVCDVHNKRVQIFNETGQFIGEYNSWKPVADEMPWQISITNSGQIGVQLDNTIVILNNKYQLLWHYPSKTKYSGICFIDDNHLFLSDRNNHKIRLYTSQGDLIRESGVAGFCVGQLQEPRGIAIDGADVFVVCEGRNMVQKF